MLEQFRRVCFQKPPICFQANLPEFMPDVSIEERRRNCHYEEEMTWEPGRIHDHDLVIIFYRR